MDYFYNVFTTFLGLETCNDVVVMTFCHDSELLKAMPGFICGYDLIA